MDYKSVAWNPKGRAGRLRNTQDITRLYAETLCQRISRRIIRDCQSLKDCLLSGDDTGLSNIWDEVCVQIQGGESIYWDVYEEALDRMAFDYLTALTDYELQTDEGWDWRWESENNPEEIPDSDPDFLLDDLAHYVLRTHVYPAAGRWSNRRIEAYLMMA
jgi:hypothetical protein